eukprot:g6324.t1
MGNRRQICRDFFLDFAALRRVPHYLWVIFLLKVLESFAYFSSMLNFTLYLSEEHGYSDSEAGWLYGTFGVLISAYGLLCGYLIDWLGVRRSLMLGSAVSASGRALFALAEARGALLLSVLFLMPLGMALGIPVLTIAVKRYSCDANRTFLFGVFYSVMNVAALMAGPSTDALNAAFEGGLEVGGRRLSSLRLLLLLGALTTACMVGVAAGCLREVAVDDRTGQVAAFAPGHGGGARRAR